MEFTIDSCIQGHRFSKEFCTPKVKSWLLCQRDEGDPNDVYTVAVKTDRTKTVQIKLDDDLLSFQLHLIIDFVPTEWKLAHGPVKFPARSISHFARISFWLRPLNCHSKLCQITYFQQSVKIPGYTVAVQPRKWFPSLCGVSSAGSLQLVDRLLP